jgi:polysaccharide export outer membrane protein
MIRPSMLTLLLAMVAAGPVLAQPAAEPASEGYAIGIEDVLQVSVWGERELSLSVPVRPDGKISVPLVQDITVVGLTPAQVRDRITERLAQFIREPNVTVIVQEINSFRVYFLGEIAEPGALQFQRPVRLLQAVASAGGLTEFAKKEVWLLREQQGVEKRVRIDYRKLLAGDPAQENIWLQPGDTLLFE